MDINDLKRQRAELVTKARALMTTAEEARRDLMPEEEQTFDRLMGEADTLDTSIKREETLREQERRAAGENPPADDPTPAGIDARQMQAWGVYLAKGRAALTPEQARTLIAGSDPEGGFLVAPPAWVAELLQRVDDEVQLRQYCTVERITTSESLGVPTLDTDLNDADWTSEIATGAQDDALRLGKRELTPNPLAKRVKVSRKLLRLTSGQAETLVRDRMAYKFAVTGEKAFLTGDGNKKPLGLFTATAQGISTARDVSLGSGGAIPLTTASADQLIDAKYTLKAAYWRRARWLFHRDLIKTIRKFKTTDGFYVWKAGLTDQPDTILELPYLVSEFAPNTISGGQYVGMLADFTAYWIVDALDMEVQRLVELYAETNQVGFIGRMETDGMPTLEEAFVRIKVPA